MLKKNRLCLWLAVLFGALGVICGLWYGVTCAAELLGKLRDTTHEAERKARNIIDAVIH